MLLADFTIDSPTHKIKIASTRIIAITMCSIQNFFWGIEFHFQIFVGKYFNWRFERLD